MTIIGLSGGHDANWALLRDGVILGAFEKERYTRRRHDGGEVANLARQTMDALGIAPQDITVVATSEPVHLGLDSGARLLGGRKYRRADNWEHQIVELFGRILPAVSVPHHLCHAAYAVYTSPFSDCLAVTLDGGGDFYTEQAYTCATISMWKAGRLQFIEAVPNVGFGSLWFTYARALFGDGNHSGKLMGLAGFGGSGQTAAFYDRFTAPVRGLFGNVRAIKDCWPDYEDPPFMRGVQSWRDPNAKAIARAVQDLTTTCGVDFVRAAQAGTGARNVVLSGGVFLNGYLTTAIRKAGLFDGVHVPPAVHDGGIALGAALFVHHHVLERDRESFASRELAFLGGRYDPSAMLHDSGLRADRMDAESAAVLSARKLSEGEVVAVFEGRSEHGARALGNRSLLASASIPGTRERINSTVKFRESFRPLAPIVHQEHVRSFFDMDWNSPYMMYIVDTTKSMQATCAEGCHVDGTARVQVIDSGKDFTSLALNAYKQYTNIPVLLNTSFNLSEPIVETPQEAIATFCKMPIQTMWLDGWMVNKTE